VSLGEQNPNDSVTRFNLSDFSMHLSQSFSLVVIGLMAGVRPVAGVCAGYNFAITSGYFDADSSTEYWVTDDSCTSQAGLTQGINPCTSGLFACDDQQNIVGLTLDGNQYRCVPNPTAETCVLDNALVTNTNEALTVNMQYCVRVAGPLI
jgi:hypothetical protein